LLSPDSNIFLLSPCDGRSVHREHAWRLPESLLLHRVFLNSLRGSAKVSRYNFAKFSSFLNPVGGRVVIFFSLTQTPWNVVLPEKLISHSASQILRRVWNPKVHYRVHNSQPPIRILSQMNPINTLPTYFPETHCNIIFPSTSRSSEWSLPFRLTNRNFVRISHLLMRPTCSAHLILLDVIILIMFHEDCALRSSSLCSFLQSRVTSSFLGPNILSALFSYNLNLCCSLDVRNRVSNRNNYNFYSCLLFNS
jgi:hypothetical protein